MNRIALYLIAVIVAVTLLLFTCTFQVRFNETAIVTTFRKIGRVVKEPGLHFKWPYPVQSVKNYDSRVHVLETRLENVMTKDSQLVVAQLFLAWKIEDPSTFFRVITSEATADKRLNERLRSALGLFADYDFHDLLDASAESGAGGKSNLASLEDRIIKLLRSPTDKAAGVEAEYGIKPVAVGISRFILPENTSKSVFERMTKTREAIAAGTSSSGQAEAERIIARANSDSRTIESFAMARASDIRALGDKEAANLAAQLSRNERFAIFLQKLQALEAIISKDTKVILPAGQSPFDLLNGPDGQPIKPATPVHSESNN